MGGRGAPAPPIPEALRLPVPDPEPGTFHYAPPEPDTYDYVAITSRERPPGGPHYAFLENLGRAWTIITHDLDATDEIHPYHTFGMDTPTLRWVKDDAVVDVYVDGMAAEDFLAATGLELHLDKGGYALSKRLSRIMRPYFVSGEFEPGEVTIRYLDQSEDEAKVWDGAGVISRRMLEKLAVPDDLHPARADRLRRELAHTRRVEFTLMTARGQDKGHAIVSDDLDVDFLLPRDTKGEVRLTSGVTWVGVDFVHGRVHMRLDIQSLINLYPFFEEAQLATWLHDEGVVFAAAVESGDVVEPMARIDRHETLEDVQRWATREYFASGGHPLWFRHHTRALMNRHLERLTTSTLGKLRLPIPGGRCYVMPAGVGAAAGLTLDVPREQVHIDRASGTAWVSDADWLALQDSPTGTGIAGILGGADNDDALWLHPFTDHDGQRKVLAWRSPNQVGEAIVLRPTPDSDILAWTAAGGETVAFPPGDIRRLPSRIDCTSPEYLGLVDPATAGGLGEGEGYSIAVMDRAIERARANRGALGMTCNTLMVIKAIEDAQPGESGRSPLPAPLEDIIDASVKTGADLSRVVAWNYARSRRMLESGTPIPRLLHERLAVDYGDAERRPPPPIPTAAHWLDQVERSVREHIAEMEARRDELAARTMPPRRVFDSVLEDPQTVEWGAQLNAAYTRVLAQVRRAGRTPSDEDFDRARGAAEAYLARFPAGQHTAILRGALASAYLVDEPRSDAALWLMGEKTAAGWQPGIAQQSIRALREIGVLDEIGETDWGLIAYPGAVVHEPPVRTVGITGVWFNAHREQERAAGRPVPEKMGDVPRHTRRAAKARIAHLAKTHFPGMRLRVGVDEAGRLAVFAEQGSLFGCLKGAGSDLQAGDMIELGLAVEKDGNVRVQYERLEPGSEGAA